MNKAIHILSLSNASLSRYPNNSLTSFIHHLPTPIRSKDKQYCIALTSLVIHNALKNSDDNVGFLKVHLAQLHAQEGPRASDAKCLARVPFQPASGDDDTSVARWHLLENPIFLPLQPLDVIDEFAFLITDQDNNQLPLKFGPATVINLELRNMEYASTFSLSIDADLSRNLYSDNTTTRWRTELPRSMKLGPGWEAALHSVHVPRALYMENTIMRFTLHKYAQTLLEDPYESHALDAVMELSVTKYQMSTDPELVLGALSKFFLEWGFALKLETDGSIIIKRMPYVPSVPLPQDGRKIILTEEDRWYTVQFNELACYLLRLPYQPTKGTVLDLPLDDNATKVLREPLDGYNWSQALRSNRIDNLCVYNDLVEPSIIGNVISNLLEILPTEELGLLQWDRDIFFPVKNLVFRGVSPRMSSTIETCLTTLQGEQPPLAYHPKYTTDFHKPLSITIVLRKRTIN